MKTSFVVSAPDDARPDHSVPSATTIERTATTFQPCRITRFGDLVDVRNRGAIQIRRLAGNQSQLQHAPAVVRVWHAETCKEMTTHEARALAGQLLAAAALVESQNGH